MRATATTLAVDDQGAGHGHDVLAGLGVVARPGDGIHRLNGAGDIKGIRFCAGGKAVPVVIAIAGDLDSAAIRINELDLDAVLVGEPVGHIILGILEVLGLGAGGALADGALRLALELGAHAGVVVPRQGHREGGHRQQDDKQHHADGVDHPSLADAFEFVGFHVWLFPLDFLSQKPHLYP